MRFTCCNPTHGGIVSDELSLAHLISSVPHIARLANEKGARIAGASGQLVLIDLDNAREISSDSSAVAKKPARKSVEVMRSPCRIKRAATNLKSPIPAFKE